ncbi:MAG: C-type lectin domain-containing protein [Ruminococcaceae bacterium]|nr:C-type lectin domain-containing protein [Oscillospiraceae bacterium]
MKRIITMLLAFVLMISSLAITAFANDSLDGTYEGWYYATQGQTGLTLTIENGEGKFEFYNMPGKNNAANGSYTVKAYETDKGYKVEGVEWIERPFSYSFVYLEGSLSGDTYEGLVDGSTSWPFVLIRNNSEYQQIADNVFNNHKYEVFEEGLTWEEAKVACEQKGGHLVTITSKQEQDFVETLIAKGNKNGYWLGGYAASQNEDFQWVTEEAMEYTNWGENQPDYANQSGDYEDKMMMYNVYHTTGNTIGQWNDSVNQGAKGIGGISFTADSLGYICEWETWTDSAEWSTPELEEAAKKGLIPDVLVGKDMTNPITRGEFAAVCVNLFEAMTGGRAVMSSECRFNDIASNENRNYILKAYNIGAVLGISETEYAPDTLLSREQLATMLTRVYKRCEWPDWTIATDDQYSLNYSGVNAFADDSEISDYARPSVYFMVKNGILAGIGNNLFAPKNTTSSQEATLYANATREQAIAMSLRSLEKLN